VKLGGSESEARAFEKRPSSPVRVPDQGLDRSAGAAVVARRFGYQ
jgi:hypothetical protein